MSLAAPADPQEPREALARLREAGARLRRRPAREVLAALARLLDAFADPRSPWRAALEEALPAATGFAPATVAEGLRVGLAPLRGAALEPLVERELGSVDALDGRGGALVAGFPTTGVILAGSLPTPTLVALLAPLTLRSAVLAKVASRDPVTAPLVARALAEIDPELAAALAVTDFRSTDEVRLADLLEADCVVASGDDATIATLAARVHPPRRFVGHGHRLSLAVIGARLSASDQELYDLAAALARDVALWDQLGCLSCAAVYVAAPAPRAGELAERLAAALAAAETRWPRGRVEPAVHAAIQDARGEAEMRAADGRRVDVHASPSTAFTVVLEEDGRWRPTPLHRFVRVHPVDALATLAADLRPLAGRLSTAAVAGFDPEEARQLARLLAELGASRICPPGEMQAPPLAWRHDNQGVLAPLARWTDLLEPRTAAP